MGSIVGAGLLSHAPVVMFPEAVRLEANGGRDFAMATGLAQLEREVFSAIEHDAVVVVDSHWTTTTETVITSAGRREGLFTSSEMPSALCRLPYDLPGDAELAHAVVQQASLSGQWIVAVDDAHLPVHYGTLVPWSYLQKPGRPWLSISVCQTATVEDFLEIGKALAAAVSVLDRRVMVVASGGLSHTFWPLRELRARMAGDPANIVSPEHRRADLERIAWLEAGDHARVIDTMDDFVRFQPEAGFGHYLTLAGAIGGRAATVKGRQFGTYESGIGTGQAHIWFDLGRERG
jgi:aromatic ring-opening dioxygenase catalytic subunit (LigB family)